MINKQKVLILYNGEYRTFEYCLKSHFPFLATTHFDVSIAFSTWNETTTANPISGLAFQPNWETFPITKSDVQKVFRDHNINLPIHIRMHPRSELSTYAKKYAVEGGKKQLPPIMVSWKLAIKYLQELEKEHGKFDYVFMLRPDLFFPNSGFTFCPQSVKNFINKNLIGVYERRPFRESGFLTDVFFFASSDTIKKYFDHLHTYWINTDTSKRYHWHGWLGEATQKGNFKCVEFPGLVELDHFNEYVNVTWKDQRTKRISHPQINRFPANHNETFADINRKWGIWVKCRNRGLPLDKLRTRIDIKNHLFAFDLDGTLVDTMDLHYDALNDAISITAGKEYVITPEERPQYEGTSTKQKLERLGAEKGLSREHFEMINTRKQQFTRDRIETAVSIDENLQAVFKSIKSGEGNKIVIVTNCIRSTTLLLLEKLGLLELIDEYVCNEDGLKPKPSPDMYKYIIDKLKYEPRKTIIFEDSDTGWHAAINSDANAIRVKSPKDITEALIFKYIAGFLPINQELLITQAEDLTRV